MNRVYGIIGEFGFQSIANSARGAKAHATGKGLDRIYYKSILMKNPRLIAIKEKGKWVEPKNNLT